MSLVPIILDFLKYKFSDAWELYADSIDGTSLSLIKLSFFKYRELEDKVLAEFFNNYELNMTYDIPASQIVAISDVIS